MPMHRVFSPLRGAFRRAAHAEACQWGRLQLARAGKEYTVEMGAEPQGPMQLSTVEIPGAHSQLVDALDCGELVPHIDGFIFDMLVKREGHQEVRIPHELQLLEPIVSEMAAFERSLYASTAQYTDLNAYLLLDLRTVNHGHAQRDAEWNRNFHFDGFISQPFDATKESSLFGGSTNHGVFTWTNSLPTHFLTSGVHFPDDLITETRSSRTSKDVPPAHQPASNICLRVKNRMNESAAAAGLKPDATVVTPPPNSVLRFDGATPHAAGINQTGRLPLPLLSIDGVLGDDVIYPYPHLPYPPLTLNTIPRLPLPLPPTLTTLLTYRSKCDGPSLHPPDVPSKRDVFCPARRQ